MKKQLYKTTQFCYTTYNEKNELLIINTFTGKMLKVLPGKAKEIKTLLEKGTKSLENIETQILYNEKILVPIEADEYAFYHKNYNMFINRSLFGLTILPTHKCNCRCVYCYEDFQGQTMSEVTQNNLYLFAKEYLSCCSSMQVTWFGGEPLLGIDVIRNLSSKFLELCSASKKPYSASIVTNGTLLTLECFKELLKYKVISYQITIDGNKNIHDYQRPLVNGGSSYDLIIKNLSDIKSSFKNKSFHIVLRINLTKLSLNSVNDYIKELTTLFGNDSRFKLHFNIAADWGGERINDFSSNLLTIKDNPMDKIRTVIDKIGQSIHVIKIEDSNSLCEFSTGCHVGCNNHFTIDSSGRVYKCAQTIRSEIKPIGDFSVSPYKWDEYEYSKWEFLAGFESIPQKCRDCFLLPTGCHRASCVVGKYNTQYIINSPLLEPKCPRIKYNIKSHLLELDKKGQFTII